MNNDELKKLTTWQRAVLYVIYLHDIVERGGGVNEDFAMSRRALEHALWFDWVTYHTLRIRELVSLGWLEEMYSPRYILHYRLTDAARVNLSRDYHRARHNSYAWNDSEVPF